MVRRDFEGVGAGNVEMAEVGEGFITVNLGCQGRRSTRCKGAQEGEAERVVLRERRGRTAELGKRPWVEVPADGADLYRLVHDL